MNDSLKLKPTYSMTFKDNEKISEDVLKILEAYGFVSYAVENIPSEDRRDELRNIKKKDCSSSVPKILINTLDELANGVEYGMMDVTQKISEMEVIYHFKIFARFVIYIGKTTIIFGKEIPEDEPVRIPDIKAEAYLISTIARSIMDNTKLDYDKMEEKTGMSRYDIEQVHVHQRLMVARAREEFMNIKPSRPCEFISKADNNESKSTT